MIVTQFKMLLISILLLGCINFASSCESDIFTIVNDKFLQRKIESSNVVNNIENSAYTFPRPLDKFFLLSIEELTELRRIKNEQIKEDILPLPSIYINLAENGPSMFHDVEYSHFYDFEHSSMISETIKTDLRTGTVGTIYKAKLPDLILHGKTTMNGTRSDFIFNITEPVLEVTREKQKSHSDRMMPFSALETFSFKGYCLIIELNNSTDNQIIESPNGQILPQLAASWFVTIFNAVNTRFIKPRLMRYDHSLLTTLKDDFLKHVAFLIANYIGGRLTYPSIISSFDSKYEYKFENISVHNFQHFQECSTSSQSLFLERVEKNVYSHHINLVFKRPSLEATAGPSVQYFSIKRYSYNYRYSWENENKIFNQLFIEQWSIKLLVLTDTYGHPVNEDEMKINVDFELVNFSNSIDVGQKANQIMFLELFEKSLAERCSELISSNELVTLEFMNSLLEAYRTMRSTR